MADIDESIRLPRAQIGISLQSRLAARYILRERPDTHSVNCSPGDRVDVENTIRTSPRYFQPHPIPNARCHLGPLRRQQIPRLDHRCPSSCWCRAALQRRLLSGAFDTLSVARALHS
ncbi:hypothetical protein B2J93_6808 [Marssonina coronariae]|uniref:Uncharacterized protein n=1 Tax=Diplocarpon coronariae TaxID=2795749 RepID=A0A218YWA2_9HELO|nr:hypothetical protein B2J93_6808 [Marssonina coronariae]